MQNQSDFYYKRLKVRGAFRWRNWKIFMITWGVIILLSWGAYDVTFGNRAKIMPELGMSYIMKFGNTVERVQEENNEIRVKFSPAPRSSGLDGGVIFGNLFTVFERSASFLKRVPFFGDMSLVNGKAVHLKVRGKRGGEKFELKIRNRNGESWIIVGDQEFPITTTYQELVIPLERFELATMGVPFDHRDGLNAFVLGLGSSLNRLTQTEIHIASLKVTNDKRRDWLAGALVLAIICGTSAIVRLNIIYNTKYNVFISYAHEDKKLVELVSNEMQSCGIRVWVDYSRLETGQPFPPAIADGINSSHYFVLIASNYLKNSQYAGIEIGIRVRRPRFRLCGIEIKSGLRKVDNRNIIVVDVVNEKDKSDNVPDIFRDLHRIIAFQTAHSSLDDIAQDVSGKIVQRIYSYRPRKTGFKTA